MATTTTEPKWEPQKHWTSTEFHTSARLHLQHWLFQSTLGFLLHPTIVEDIKTRSGDISIADIGCGNAAWLCDLSRNLKTSPISPDQTYNLTGLDITTINFPHPSHLPSNITLRKHDIFAADSNQPPQQQYDIINIRAFGSSIRHNDTKPLLDALTRLLKPNGWLQWAESASHHMSATAPSSEVSATASNMLLQILAMGGKASGTVFEWLDDLPARVASHGFNGESVKVLSYPTLREQWKAWTENYLIVYEELSKHFPSGESNPSAPMTKEKYEGLFAQVVKETENGVVLQQGEVLCVVGRMG